MNENGWMFSFNRERWRIENGNKTKKSQKIYDPFNSVSFHFKWPFMMIMMMVMVISYSDLYSFLYLFHRESEVISFQNGNKNKNFQMIFMYMGWWEE